MLKTPLKQSLLRCPFTLWTLVASLSFLNAVSLNGSEEPENGDFWSFKRPEAQRPPALKDETWIQTRIDRFILARLEKQGLQPSRKASPAELARRIGFDVTGLPPSMDQLELLRFKDQQSGLRRYLERLLNSPRFGERMASLWLPIVRYAEDQAHQVGSDLKHFYPNAHFYRQWVIDAFNRDLPYTDFIKLQLASDLVEGPDSPNLAALGFMGLGHKYYNRGRLDVMADEWEDRVDTVTRGLMGITLACARCHDHKYDPFPAEDYYAMAGIFSSIELVNSPPLRQEKDAKGKSRLIFPQEALHIIKDKEPKNLPVYVRGDVGRPGDIVHRGFPGILNGGPQSAFENGSGRRELAELIVSDENPLTARVYVNRIWGAIMGHPLVMTPSNFGRLGAPPSHPELLDDLTVRFIKNGWSTKWLIKELILSATYQQAIESNVNKETIDPANQWLWKAHRKRQSAESYRDLILYAADRLVHANGPSMELDDPKNNRRTVFGRISRLELNTYLTTFDYPDANVHAAKRQLSITPLQNLFRLNNQFILKQSKAMGVNLIKRTRTKSVEEVVSGIYLKLFSRLPNETEVSLALNYLGEFPSEDGATQYCQGLLVSNEAIYFD